MTTSKAARATSITFPPGVMAHHMKTRRRHCLFGGNISGLILCHGVTATTMQQSLTAVLSCAVWDRLLTSYLDTTDSFGDFVQNHSSTVSIYYPHGMYNAPHWCSTSGVKTAA